MKMRYLAAGLIGAWWLGQRARKQELAAPTRGPQLGRANNVRARVRPVAGTPFRVKKDGVKKP